MRGTTSACLAVAAMFMGPTRTVLAAPDAATMLAPSAIDLASLTLRELELQQALPLARRGYVFRTRWLNQYFRGQRWYTPTGFDPRALPTEEREHIEAVARFRASLSKADLDRRYSAFWDRSGVPVSRDVVADEIEQALLNRAQGRSAYNPLLDELPFNQCSELLAQPLDTDDLVAYTKQGHDLREIEALIYARRGRPFASPRWRSYAQDLDWYRADPKYRDDSLTALDKANLSLLTGLERKLEPRPSHGRPDVAARIGKGEFPACPAGTKRRQLTEESGAEAIYCAKSMAGGEVMQGPRWTWLPTGKLRQTRTLVNDKDEGPSVTWFWTGVRKEEGAFAKGQRQGAWRVYHPNGKLADESTFEADKLHGPRRRFFASGKASLDATYEHGSPVGKWTAYYDNGQTALVATFPGTSVQGWRMDGTPWPTDARVSPCRDRKCTSPIEHIEMDSLPPVFPAQDCPAAGVVPRGSWKPILSAVRRHWEGEASYVPGCVSQVTLLCAPDLDGVPGTEALAQIDYHILINGESNCATKRLDNMWQMSVLVALSPPGQRANWSVRGFVGYPRFEADNGGTETSVLGFVRLPSREVALHTSDYSDPGDCGPGTFENVVVLRKGKWEGVAGRVIHACDRPDEAEEWDVF